MVNSEIAGVAKTSNIATSKNQSGLKTGILSSYDIKTKLENGICAEYNHPNCDKILNTVSQVIAWCERNAQEEANTKISNLIVAFKQIEQETTVNPITRLFSLANKPDDKTDEDILNSASILSDILKCLNGHPLFSQDDCQNLTNYLSILESKCVLSEKITYFTDRFFKQSISQSLQVVSNILSRVENAPVSKNRPQGVENWIALVNSITELDKSLSGTQANKTQAEIVEFILRQIVLNREIFYKDVCSNLYGFLRLNTKVPPTEKEIQEIRTVASQILNLKEVSEKIEVKEPQSVALDGVRDNNQDQNPNNLPEQVTTINQIFVEATEPKVDFSVAISGLPAGLKAALDFASKNTSTNLTEAGQEMRKARIAYQLLSFKNYISDAKNPTTISDILEVLLSQIKTLSSPDYSEATNQIFKVIGNEIENTVPYFGELTEIRAGLESLYNQDIQPERLREFVLEFPEISRNIMKDNGSNQSTIIIIFYPFVRANNLNINHLITQFNTPVFIETYQSTEQKANVCKDYFGQFRDLGTLKVITCEKMVTNAEWASKLFLNLIYVAQLLTEDTDRINEFETFQNLFQSIPLHFQLKLMSEVLFPKVKEEIATEISPEFIVSDFYKIFSELAELPGYNLNILIEKLKDLLVGYATFDKLLYKDEFLILLTKLSDSIKLIIDNRGIYDYDQNLRIKSTNNLIDTIFVNMRSILNVNTNLNKADTFHAFMAILNRDFLGNDPKISTLYPDVNKA